MARSPHDPPPFRDALLVEALVLIVTGILLLAALMPTAAAGMTWRDDDWSAGRYVEASGIDPEICPGHLVLDNDLNDFRFVGSPTHFQGLYSMAAYHDTLFITASDYPYMYDGADVIAYDYLRDSFEVVYQPFESGLHIVKAIGDTLYIPGPDSQDLWTLPGSIYTYDGDEWREKATLPRAIHVNDVDVVDNVIYATTGQLGGDGCVCRSTDGGETFTPVLCIHRNEYQPDRRMFGLCHIGNRIFAQPDGFPTETGVLYTSIDGINWMPVPVPHMPVDKMAMFTNWHDQLLMTINDRMYVWNGISWLEYSLPFAGWRWWRGICGYKDDLYGGANTCRIHRWLGGSNWEPLGSLNVDVATTEIESIIPYFGRLYVSTSRPEQGGEMRPGLYVSAAIPSGSLVSLPHDYGVRTTGGSISWTEYRPAVGHQAMFQVRSALTAEALPSRPFVGPDGTSGTYYASTNSSLAPIHDGDRFFQYRVELRCPLKLRMPVLHDVEVRVDSMDVAANGEEVQSDGSTNPRNVGVMVELGMPFPNPASERVDVELRARAARAEDRSQEPVLAQLRVTDLQGRVVRSEMIRVVPGSSARWTWDLRGADGRRVASGIYWIRTSTDGASVAETARPVQVLR